jgi:hypothetical protein
MYNDSYQLEVKIMPEVITVRLSPENRLGLDWLLRQQVNSLEQIINQALKNYLFAQKFDELCTRLSQPTEDQKVYTEEEIFELVS